MEIKAHKNMVNLATDINVRIEDFEIDQMKEAVFHHFIKAVTEKFVELHGADIIASIDREILTAKINAEVSGKIVENALTKLELNNERKKFKKRKGRY